MAHQLLCFFLIWMVVTLKQSESHSTGARIVHWLGFSTNLRVNLKHGPRYQETKDLWCFRRRLLNAESFGALGRPVSSYSISSIPLPRKGRSCCGQGDENTEMGSQISRSRTMLSYALGISEDLDPTTDENTVSSVSVLLVLG